MSLPCHTPEMQTSPDPSVEPAQHNGHVTGRGRGGEREGREKGERGGERGEREGKGRAEQWFIQGPSLTSLCSASAEIICFSLN